MYYSQNQSLDKVLSRKVIQDFDIDFSMLNSIMYKQSPTDNKVLNKEKAQFLIGLIFEHTGVLATTDQTQNLYFVKGEATFYPTIVAHYDTAQDYHPGLTIQKAGNWLYGFDVTTGTQCGIGADDSVGIYFAIEMLKRLPACKVVLFYGEERGCIGSYNCNMEFFKDSLLVSQLDRRSFQNDFIVHTNGVEVFPMEHLDVIQTFLDKYDYSIANGSCTDVGALRRSGLEVASHNTACGYFNEHTDEEIIHIPSMSNAMSMVYEIQSYLLEQNTQLVFPYVAPPVKNFTQGSTQGSTQNSAQLHWSWDYESYPTSSTGIPSKVKDTSDWNYYLNENVDVAEIEFHFDVAEKDITLANVKNDLVPPQAYAAYHMTGYNTFLEKEVYIPEELIREALTSREPRDEMNSCCVEHYHYNVQFNTVTCDCCNSSYHFPFTPEDIYSLPDDNDLTLDAWMDVV